MNKELIKKLYAERKRLYPNGCPVPPRGCGKTFVYLSHYLTYIAYDFVCDIYKHLAENVSWEEAHNDMKHYINNTWNLVRERVGIE